MNQDLLRRLFVGMWDGDWLFVLDVAAIVGKRFEITKETSFQE